MATDGSNNDSFTRCRYLESRIKSNDFSDGNKKIINNAT
tara:strand:+ start:142 stop:258 length:117 start_codon:yes stop_codon:yes gene_type:complete